MDRPRVTVEQAKKVNETIQPMLKYLHMLEERMRCRGFTPSDPLYALVVNAHEGMHSLFVETHYLRCKSGVGRGPRE